MKKKKKKLASRAIAKTHRKQSKQNAALMQETKRNKIKVRLPILYQYHPALENRTTNEKRYYFYDLSIDGLYVVGLV